MTTRRIKDPDEIVTVTFRYAKRARSVSSPVVTCTVLEGTDPAAADMILGTAQVDPADPTQVLQRVQAGVPGCTYGLKALATNEKGDRPACAGIIYVRTLPEYTS